ncbi:MAG: hypothetical protein AVO33_05000 [delta proteobacterium ML8_F1]|nr:MAG: hypothetical protein AVO33_05000 [delta proteobacterium ML8_F1]
MFEGILGHEAQKNEILKQMEEHKISHAYIFEGISGIGKSLVAKSFARGILCDASVYACGECRSCRLYKAQTHPDYLEVIDEKSVKVKDILEVSEFLRTKPILSRYKVVLIRDAHKMTTGAQNKLLKIFENPPAYVVIILVVDNMDLVLDTVQSRGYRIYFKELTEKNIQDFLQVHYQLSQEEMLYSVRFSQGSVARAAAIAGAMDTQNLIGYPERIFNAIVGNDPYQSLKLLQEVSSAPELIEYLLTWIRDISILKESPDTGVFNESRLNALRSHAVEFDTPVLMNFAEILEKGKRMIAGNINPVVSLNYCLLKIQEEYYEFSRRREI